MTDKIKDKDSPILVDENALSATASKYADAFSGTRGMQSSPAVNSPNSPDSGRNDLNSPGLKLQAIASTLSDYVQNPIEPDTSTAHISPIDLINSELRDTSPDPYMDAYNPELSLEGSQGYSNEPAHEAFGDPEGNSQGLRVDTESESLSQSVEDEQSSANTLAIIQGILNSKELETLSKQQLQALLSVVIFSGQNEAQAKIKVQSGPFNTASRSSAPPMFGDSTQVDAISTPVNKSGTSAKKVAPLLRLVSKIDQFISADKRGDLGKCPSATEVSSRNEPTFKADDSSNKNTEQKNLGQTTLSGGSLGGKGGTTNEVRSMRSTSVSGALLKKAFGGLRFLANPKRLAFAGISAVAIAVSLSALSQATSLSMDSKKSHLAHVDSSFASQHESEQPKSVAGKDRGLGVTKQADRAAKAHSTVSNSSSKDKVSFKGIETKRNIDGTIGLASTSNIEIADSPNDVVSPTQAIVPVNSVTVKVENYKTMADYLKARGGQSERIGQGGARQVNDNHVDRDALRKPIDIQSIDKSNATLRGHASAFNFAVENGATDSELRQLKKSFTTELIKQGKAQDKALQRQLQEERSEEERFLNINERSERKVINKILSERKSLDRTSGRSLNNLLDIAASEIGESLGDKKRSRPKQNSSIIKNGLGLLSATRLTPTERELGVRLTGSSDKGYQLVRVTPRNSMESPDGGNARAASRNPFSGIPDGEVSQSDGGRANEYKQHISNPDGFEPVNQRTDQVDDDSEQIRALKNDSALGSVSLKQMTKGF